MVLKSLLLQGFKSFPDKTEIRFLGGLTAIVGPNGSGKSNISDAIRWVLGEQSSRSLRGAKMEDVIFGGTTKRGPLGFAEVSLILDNAQGIFRSDYTEIMVSRRYYRSGDSEYSINKKNCRLKDIHELFMDTGLGRDGYSIIGQGRIDEILSLKSEDRREIFEEAAGITKFRYRKEEAERKLAATEENLSRIRDIYAELEERREPLEKQAEKARQFLRLRDELRTLEISLWLLALDQIHKDAATNQEALKSSEEGLKKARDEQEALYQKSELLAADIRKLEQETEALRSSLRITEQRVAEHASRCAVIHANIENYQENIRRTKEESGRQAEKAQSLEGQLAARHARCEELDAAHQKLLTAQATAFEKHSKLCVQREEFRILQTEQKQKKSVLENERFQLELDRSATQSALQNMDARRGTIDDEIAATSARVTEEEKRQAELAQQLKECLETVASAENKLLGVSLKVERRGKKSEDLAEAVRNLSAERTDCQNRIRMLTEMQKDYEGYSRSVKVIMGRAECGALHGIHGPVSSLLEVPEEYVCAIETALGAAASNIVVDDPQTGRAAIAYLKKNDGGRATFLPIDTIRPNVLHEQGLERLHGFCGVADTLVHCQPQYKKIVSNLLGRTVIAEDMEAALTLSKSYANRFRIVTKDGQIIQAGGAMTGGSVSKTTGVLARVSTLKALEARLIELNLQQEQADKAYELARSELCALNFDMKAIEAERTRAQEAQAGFSARCEQHKALVESIQKQHDDLVLERENLFAARQQREQKIEDTKNKLQQIKEKMSALEQAIQEMDSTVSKQAADELQNQQEQAKIATSIAENRSETAAERRALEDLEALKHGMTETLMNSESSISNFEEQIAQLMHEKQQAEEQHQADEENAGKLRKLINASTKQRMRIEGNKTAVDKQAQVQGEAILKLERENSRLESRAVQLQNEEMQILDKMWENYELTPTPAAQAAKPIVDLSQAEKQVADLKNKQRALGNVNLDSVDEYNKLMGRYEFLTIQKNDLERAQRELYKVIDQLTVNMKEIFASEFAKLNAYFGETFCEIFDGGYAELRLEDTADILNCGIEIRVSPPGKALKTITLLSGGEKAFVAIALYFAILKVRPTPFCILDEIEAALDDVNVTRFAKYIRRLTDNTQFIVITHRRGTMEEADMLYGVTMQEHGVSKLLMLNLAEAEQRLGMQIQ